MTRRGGLAKVAGWKHWDVVALVSGAIPLLVMLAGLYFQYNFGGRGVGIMVAAGLLYMGSTALAWRGGDGRMIASGCAMLMISLLSMLPVILGTAFLLAACFMGDCL